MLGQSKLLPPEKMKHSIKLVDDQMNWCDSAMEVGLWLINSVDCGTTVLNDLVMFLIYSTVSSQRTLCYVVMCCSI